MSKFLYLNNVILIISSLSVLISCAEIPRQNINWNDRRCVTVHDVWVRYNYEKKNGNSTFFATMTGNLRTAHRINTGGGVIWVDSFTGDSKRVWVGYNELGEITSIKDTEGTEISLADLDRLGPFINKYDDSAKNDPAYQLAWELAYKKLTKYETFRAAKKPENCN
jgi:hypothetical protein